MTFSIVIATHGADVWKELARHRALPSAVDQGAEVLIAHDTNATRAEVRNRLIAEASGDWIITLDADDELAPGYVAAMKEVQLPHENCLLTPMVSYVRNNMEPEPPMFLPEVNLKRGNWMVVGTAAPRKLMRAVGGWRTFTGSGILNEWDDWDMWIRCVAAGAEIVKVPDAVYRAYVRKSPHYSVQSVTSKLWLQEIRQANGLGG